MEHSRNFKERNDVRVMSIERTGSGCPLGDWLYDVVVDAYGEIEEHNGVVANRDFRSFKNSLIRRMNRLNIDNEAETEEMFREANYMG